MADLASPNTRPGRCSKCRGSGQYRWGSQAQFSGTCHSCGGKGSQTAADIKRCRTYNRHRIAHIARHRGA